MYVETCRAARWSVEVLHRTNRVPKAWTVVAGVSVKRTIEAPESGP